LPRTNTTSTRDEKMARIVDAAEAGIARGGYEALSVAAIARELGLAQNAIYWYFPSKDELFVAALQRMLDRIAARKPSRARDTVERILWFTDEFAAVFALAAAMNERARASPVVATFVAELDATIARMLSNALAGSVPASELPLAVDAFRATVEGTFVKGLGRQQRRRILRFALAQLAQAG
jgi:AcrR family transcriptional regulator